MSGIRVTAFTWVPSFAQGLVRDLRVRWALEEAGLPYEVRLLHQGEQATDEYRRLQPFGQVPVYEEGGLVLFESGAIVLHVAERSRELMPEEPESRARTRAWTIAALNSVENVIDGLVDIDLFFPDEAWARERRPGAEQAVRQRLERLTAWLDGRKYLEADRFTAADLMMTTVLRILRHTDLVKQVPVLDDYQRRCEDRPAFQKALADQLAPFAENEPPATQLPQ